MELVGKVTGILKNDAGSLHITFRCCNHETFRLIMSPALGHIPLDTFLRVWAYRPPVEGGAAGSEPVIHHWEDLS